MSFTGFIIFFLFLAGAMVAVIMVANSVMRKKEVDQMKDLVSGKATQTNTSAGPSLIKAERPSAREMFSQLFLGKSLNGKVRDWIEQAGLSWDPARTIYMSLILAVIGFNLFWYVIPRGQPIAVVGVIIGGGIPAFIIWRKRAKRLFAFEEQFPDALEYLGRAMRTGHAFTVALEMVHKEYDDPLGEEFRRAFEEQNLGLPLEVALERLGTRVPLLDVRFFVSAVALQKRTGGNLAALLDNLSYLIRERFKLRGKIRAISAHGRISGLVLSMIPVVTAILMFLTNPEYVLFFFDDPDGKVLMVVMIILQFFGFVSIKKLTDISI